MKNAVKLMLQYAIKTLCIGACVAYGQVATPPSHPTGVIEICKTSSTTDPVTGIFNFTLSSLPGRSFDAPVGACTGPITVPAGVSMLITETPKTDTALTGVTATTVLGAPAPGVLTSTNLGAGTATITVPAGDISAQTVITFTDAKVITTGFLEICKASANAPENVTGTFTFTISGVPGTRSAPVGSCTGPIQVKAGAVTITEEITAGSILTGVSTTPPAALGTVNLLTQTATVTVTAGDISQQTLVTFTDRAVLGQLKICKIAGSGVHIGTVYSFNVGGKTFSVPAGPASTNGFCVVDGTFPVGTVVNITEAIPQGGKVTGINVAPADRIVGTASLASGSVSVTIGPGFTEVTFTDERIPIEHGTLKICKIAGPRVPLGTLYSFNVGGKTFSVPAGPAADGGFCVVDGTYFIGDKVDIKETIPIFGFVTGITVAPANRIVGAANLGTGSVSVTVGPGFTEVTFANRHGI